MTNDQAERRRRLRAARALGGFKNTADLAAAIPEDAGLGDRTLRKLESGEAELRPPVMREIAAACGLPYEFFTADFNQLREPGPGLTQTGLTQTPTSAAPRRLELLEDRMRAIEAQVAALVAAVLGRGSESPPASGGLPKASPG